MWRQEHFSWTSLFYRLRNAKTNQREKEIGFKAQFRPRKSLIT
jgi:hypothetical protein